ncbi:2-oxo acid dehydrogenase subunit E2 [Nocardia sp. NPDC059239]|uniref:2-oxo acid dehydrogenase subunit E2 n=1 Tax=Nocardia sp. NPDC059239 TaxID=3346785 RepID=UPI0036C5BA01
MPLPDLGENVTEATVTRWLKQPGDDVAIDEPILEVSTDKVDTEINSPATGTLLRIIADEDTVVPVGGALAVIGTSHPTMPPEPVPTSSPVKPAPALDPAPAPAPTPADDPAEVAPALEPTLKALEPTTTSAADRITEKLPRIRQTIARRMMESLQNSAQLTTVVEVDVTAIAAIRDRQKADFLQRNGFKLSFLPYFVKAAVDALAAHRVINAELRADAKEVTYHKACHLGIAVDGPQGLMVPVVRHAENLTVTALARSIADLAERVRANTIGVDELSGGTFTITNTGSRGALFDTPIINQPQSAILGIGTVVDRVVPMRFDDTTHIGVRSMAYLSLSYDHRIIDGADAARYLGAVKNRLETGFTAADT